MTRFINGLCAQWLCFACVLGSALAQTSGQEPVLRITTNLVQVDAVVTDSGGRQISNLTADDFQVLEDGRPQKITAFSYVSTVGPPPAYVKTKITVPPLTSAAPSPVTPPAPVIHLARQQVQRTIVLMVDDLGLSFESTARVRRALKKFVDEQMKDGDLVAIMRTRAGMGSLQQFSSDKRILYAAIDHVRWYPSGGNGVTSIPPLGTEELSNAAQMRMGGRGDGEERNFDQSRQANFWFGTLDAINFVVRALRELPGRKALILFSDGIPTEGAEGLNNLVDQANRSAVLVYTVDARALQTLGLTALDNTLDSKYRNPKVLAAALRDRADQYVASEEGLAYVARQTGGFFIHDTNDLNWGIGRVLDDLSGYYLIGYKPNESSFEPESGRRKFHKIQVKVRVHGLQVRSRTGYFGVSDAQSRPVYRTRLEQLRAALNSPFNSGDLNVRLTCLFSEVPKNGAAIRTLLHVDAHGLTFTAEPDGTRKVVLDVLASAFDDEGVVVGQSEDTHTIQLPVREYDESLSRGFVFKLNVAISKPGGYQMRVVVRDAASNRIGSASQFADVPDVRRHRLAISGILLHRRFSDGINGDISEDEYDIARSATPALRMFRRGETVSLGFVIFDARTDHQTGRPEIETQFMLYRDRHCVYASSPIPFQTQQQNDLDRLAASGTLQLGSNLAAGEYVLQVVARDKLAPKKFGVASQWTDLELAQ